MDTLTDPLALADQIKRLTQSLLQLAQSGDWDAFNEHLPARDALVRQLDQVEVTSEAMATALQEKLIAVRSLNEELVKLADAQAAALVKEKSALKKRQQMQKAYKDI
ncbi:flagellar protein FliT [Marinobacterium litorale]|uniref:flagellar protein FliT n=1 Tax=Marinobacterium litorale TaxID=404770 RepID=UPI00040BE3FA|nr:flagellar protein FliT [Marinobacterium litorale]